VHPRASGRVGIVGDEREAFGVCGRVRPLERRRSVAAFAGIFYRNWLTFGKGGAGDLEVHNFFGVEFVRATGRDQTAEHCGHKQHIHPRVHGLILLRWAQTQTEISLGAAGALATMRAMFSHIVIFWTDLANPNATDELLAGANKLLKNIPGVLQFHVGKMTPSHRPVVEQSYQIALNLIFPNKKAQDDYQVHPQHVEFVEKYVKRLVKKVVVYNFE
jgi:hypothetical protein